MNKIQKFQDLFVYQNLYQAMLVVHLELIGFLPATERFDLSSQLRRAAKAGPAILAEGWSKRYYRKTWRKYLFDTLGECNEMIHHLKVFSDIYDDGEASHIIKKLLNLYNTAARQISVLIRNC